MADLVLHSVNLKTWSSFDIKEPLLRPQITLIIECNITLSNTNEIYLEPMFLLQKRKSHISCYKPFFAHTNILFKECKIMKQHEINILCD